MFRSVYIPQAQSSPYFIDPVDSAINNYLLVFNYMELCKT